MSRSFLSIARFTLLELLRNRILWLLLMILLTGFLLSQFAGDLAITEHRNIQLSLLAAFLRLAGVLVLSLLVVSSLIREMNDKTIDLILSTSVSRGVYFFAKLVAYIILAFGISVLFGGFLLLYGESQNVLPWAGSYFAELVVMTALSLAMVFTFKQTPAAFLGVLIFYALARNIGAMSLMATHPVFAHQGLAQHFMSGFINVLSWVLPDLDRFSDTAWLVYGFHDAGIFMTITFQAVIYTLLLSGVALFDFHRKNFNT